MSIGRSSWVSIEPRLIDSQAYWGVMLSQWAGSHLKAAGQKAVAFPPQTMHTDEMELSLTTFRGDFDCVPIWQHS
ncbi:unnamed protein product [Sphagnum jensenii]|uniref:Uncharacterized protein n=1 Tax=Sphagnum jensenii TaxID=128206 RepID=A0ABP1AY38_9BRYO